MGRGPARTRLRMCRSRCGFNKMVRTWFCLYSISCIYGAGGLSTAQAQPQVVGPNTPPVGHVFAVLPYLQLGDAPYLANPATMALMWHTDTGKADWAVEIRQDDYSEWAEMPTISKSVIVLDSVPPHIVYLATLGGLAPGKLFQYRLRRNGTIVFSARGRARKVKGQPYRVVLFGDCGTGTAGQRQIAYRAYQESPDLVAITGDIVYSQGRLSEYRRKYFPVYNADSAQPNLGAPLARSVPFVAAIGNHDVGIARGDGEFAKDFWGYFAYWSLPLNGPYGSPGPNTPMVYYDSTATIELAKTFATTYPRMANYSFDYGDSHWLVLDANDYVNWGDLVLRNWVANDLANAQQARWRFVMFHQPPFSSSREHYSEQQMRLVADLFDRYHVDVVFSGHVHGYQRTSPLHFLPRLAGDPKVDGRALSSPWQYKSLPFLVDGDFALDTMFDGRTRTHPTGPIYVITAAGGERLYTPEQTDEPSSWQAFTTRFIADRFSLSVVDVSESRLIFRQTGTDGSVIDQFEIDKGLSIHAKVDGSTPMSRATVAKKTRFEVQRP